MLTHHALFSTHKIQSHKRRRISKSYTTTTTTTTPPQTSPQTSSPPPPKPYNEIPTIKGFPLLKGLKAAQNSFGSGAIQYAEQYGDMIRFSILSKNFVALYASEYAKEYMAYEPAMPEGIVSTSWPVQHRNEHMKTIDRDQNLALSGPLWKEARDHFQGLMFPPKEAQNYFPHIDRSAEYVVEEFGKMKPEELMDYLMKTAFELFHGFMYGKPSYIFREDVDPDYLTLLYSSKKWMTAIGLLTNFPKWMTMLPSIKKKVKVIEDESVKSARAWDALGVARIKEMLETQDELQNSAYVAKLGAQASNLEDAVKQTGDFLSAAVDTTSSALIWLLYHTASNPEKQALLFQQIDQELKGEGLKSQADADRVPLVNGFVKEAQRLNPVGGGTMRTYHQDVVVNGYQIPSGTTVFVTPSYATGRKETVFENASSFIPERWLPEAKSARRKAKKAFPHDSPFTLMQFSVGPRMCLGARIAHVELLCILTRLIQKYEISFVEGSEIPSMNTSSMENGLGIPEPYPKLKFTPRV